MDLLTVIRSLTFHPHMLKGRKTELEAYGYSRDKRPDKIADKFWNFYWDGWYSNCINYLGGRYMG